jgi:hypothetical protein
MLGWRGSKRSWKAGFAPGRTPAPISAPDFTGCASSAATSIDDAMRGRQELGRPWHDDPGEERVFSLGHEWCCEEAMRIRAVSTVAADFSAGRRFPGETDNERVTRRAKMRMMHISEPATPAIVALSRHQRTCVTATTTWRSSCPTSTSHPGRQCRRMQLPEPMQRPSRCRCPSRRRRPCRRAPHTGAFSLRVRAASQVARGCASMATL